MAYIISVNSTIVSQSGGTCVCPPDSPDLCDSDPDYMLCVQEVNRDLVTATAAISALTTFCMGLFANLPIALAPGMGLNAYFAYTVVGYHGSGLVPYRVAVTAVFVEGFVFVGLTILGLRSWLARAIPSSIKLATGVGIGLYLTIIGLTYSAGIGAVTGAQSTPLELAGCAPQYLDPDTGLCPSSEKVCATLHRTKVALVPISCDVSTMVRELTVPRCEIRRCGLVFSVVVCLLCC